MRFDFNDINLVPKKCIVNSRSECNTSFKLGKYLFELPIVPANMEAVIDTNLAKKLAINRFFYIMHRFGNTLEFCREMMKEGLYLSISIGVNQDSYDLLEQLLIENIIPDFITIDIAHGHSISMERMIHYLKSKFSDSFIIAGNVSTKEAVLDLQEWGADAIKVGIGPGCFIPTSKVKTSNGIKLLKEISNDDYVLTHKNRYKRVLQTHTYTGEQILLKINELPECTETHEFFVINKSDKDIINQTNIDKYAYWVKAKDLDKNKHLLVKM